MWLMTRYGFYSIVCAHQPDGRPHRGLMMIRARKRAHLTNLKHFHRGLGPIITNRGTDYPYRIIARRAVVAPLVARLLADVDYSNFKGAAEENLPVDGAYRRFLHSVWGLGLRLTPARVRRGFAEFFPDLFDGE